jgi:hypothetical protein
MPGIFCTKEEVKSRKEICNDCAQKRMTIGVGITCGTFLMPVKYVSCGCILTIKQKLADFHCPQKKW